MPKKIIKVITIIIKESRLYDEQDNVLLFKNQGRGRGRKIIMFPKKAMYNFEKIITWFPHWKGRRQEKAFKFDIPLWLYERKEEDDIVFLGDDIIVKNTHEYSYDEGIS